MVPAIGEGWAKHHWKFVLFWKRPATSYIMSYRMTMLKPHHVLMTGNVSARNSPKDGIFHIINYCHVGAKFKLQVLLKGNISLSELPLIVALCITTTKNIL